MLTSKAVKLDDEIYSRLQALGETRQRTPHWLMKEAIKQFIDREEEVESIRIDTLQRLANFEATGEAIPYEVIDSWLSTWGSENEAQCPNPTA